MKTHKKFFVVGLIAIFISSTSFAQEKYPPYYKVAEVNGTIAEVTEQVSKLLTENGFEILGSYNPGNKSTLGVVAYTRKDLKDAVLKHKHRGGIASAMRVGLVQKGNKTTVSIVNPIYLFYAYLKENTDKMPVVKRFDKDVKSAFGKMGVLKGFGGNLEKKKLIKYRYMIGMQGYGNPAKLAEFSSFNKGVATIEANLRKKVGNTVEVYKIVDPSNQVAIFGVGLLDKKEGEAHFLPIIGEDHVAAMPYEIILQGKEATMLHGRFRIALNWPELTMGTFTKIIATPGNIEDFMEALCK